MNQQTLQESASKPPRFSAFCTLGDGVLRVGKNFVDCQIGPVVSRGRVTVGARTYDWQSSFSWETAHQVIRKAARAQGLKVAFALSMVKA